MNLLGTGYRLADVAADVFRPDMPVEIGTLHQVRRLSTGATQQQFTTGPVQCVRQFLERAQSCPVDGVHVPQPEHHDLRGVARLSLMTLNLSVAPKRNGP